jgi:predicted DNA binding CopG/RHH family protein
LEEEETNLIREFHSAKGFDPESQDAAIAMRYPLVDIEAIKRSAQEASLHSTVVLHALLMIGTAH